MRCRPHTLSPPRCNLALPMWPLPCFSLQVMGGLQRYLRFLVIGRSPTEFHLLDKFSLPPMENQDALVSG